MGLIFSTFVYSAGFISKKFCQHQAFSQILKSKIDKTIKNLPSSKHTICRSIVKIKGNYKGYVSNE